MAKTIRHTITETQLGHFGITPAIFKLAAPFYDYSLQIITLPKACSENAHYKFFILKNELFIVVAGT